MLEINNVVKFLDVALISFTCLIMKSTFKTSTSKGYNSLLSRALLIT